MEDIDRNPNERNLFHLYNIAKDYRKFILFTSAVSPKELKIKLPDLRSRIMSCPISIIKNVDNEILELILFKQLSDRQINVSPEVINYILLRIDRSLAAIRELVGIIDAKSLEQKRNITIPFIKNILGNK